MCRLIDLLVGPLSKKVSMEMFSFASRPAPNLDGSIALQNLLEDTMAGGALISLGTDVTKI